VAGRKTIVVAVILLAALGAAVVWTLRPRGAAPAEDYDYAAAFESLDAASSAPVVKIPEIAGKSAEQLRALLGPPEYCESSLYSSRCSYAPGRTEVVFIDGKADWITVNELGETPLGPQALRRLGLPPSAPQLSAAGQLAWTGLAGLKQLSLIGEGDRLEYARVKVSTP
jgi:hypothetical protein